MSIQTRNRRRQRAGRETGRTYFVPSSSPSRSILGMFYKQSFTYSR